jgi:hypothetical protein
MAPHKPLFWMLALLILIPAFLAVGYFMLRPAPPAPTINTAIEQDAALDITLRPNAQPRFYSFRADPDQVTQLQLDTETPEFAFAAEVRDSSGASIAMFNGSSLNRAALTIEPGDEEYQLRLMPLDGSHRGTVMLTLGIPATPVPQPEPTSMICGAISAALEGTPVRNGPRPEYGIIGALLPEDMLMARGRIRGGWYLVELRDGMGWVPGDSVRLYGDCDQLPIVLDPAIPSAPADDEPYVLNVDRDGSSYITEAIAFPYEDTADLAWLNVLNLYDRAPSNYREFSVTLACEGVGVEALRWGAPEAPIHQCGETILIPVLYGMSQQPLLIALPPGSEQSYIRYTLSARSTYGIVA